jgi:uncharacterized membrane protein
MKKYTYTGEGDDDSKGADHQDDRSSPGDENQARSAETALGIDEKIVATLAYLIGWVTGVVFLLIEKENSFVRFHAMQSIVIFVPLTVALIVAGFIPFFGGFLDFVIGLAGLFIWLFMMFQAFQGKRFKFPYAGDYAETQLKNMGTK